ncbi:unnamed protein product [Closterium sp. NIES-53]
MHLRSSHRRAPWGDNVAIFDLDFDAILAAMYAATDSVEGDCYLCVPLDPGIEAAALGASESTAPRTSESAAPGARESALSSTAPTEALHTFTLNSSASRSFRDTTTLTPLSRPVAVSLANPSGGPDLAHSSTVLPCPAAPSGLLSGLHLPSFSTNLVSGADLQDSWVDQFTPRGQRVTHCTCSRTGCHLAMFTHRPRSSLYTLTTASPPVTVSGQVFSTASRSSLASALCSCRPLSHETLLWHHRLGHPSLPRLRGMASRTLVSGLPQSLPPLPLGLAPTCVPHSCEFPPTEAPLQTLHMDVWGPAHVRGRGHEHYFLLVVDDYSRYTTVFPLRSKGEVTEVLINWIRGARRQLSESFGSDLPVLRLHSDRGDQPSASCLLARDHTYSAVDGEGWRCFYHPTSRRVLSSQDVTFDESVSYYRLFPYRTAPLPPPPLFLAPGAPPVDPLPPQGPAPSVAELVVFAAHCRLDYATTLVVESESASVCPPSVGGESALGTDDFEDRQEEFECFAAAVPHLVSMLFAPAACTPRHIPLLCPPVTRSQIHLWTSPMLGMGLVLGGRARVVLTGHADASWVDDLATQRSSHGYTFSLGSGSVSWRSTRSSCVLSSSFEAKIYAGAMAAQELRWLTYLLTDLGEAPCSPPNLYVDNKAMPALCQEHRLEHRTKHIALRYFLARELQQRGQLCLAYVASRANNADVFTKALQPCDHQHFCTVLGLLPTVPHLLTS